MVLSSGHPSAGLCRGRHQGNEDSPVSLAMILIIKLLGETIHVEGLKNIFLPTPKIVHFGEATCPDRALPAPLSPGAVKTSGLFPSWPPALSVPGSGHCLLPQQLQERGSHWAVGSADQAEGTRRSGRYSPLALAKQGGVTTDPDGAHSQRASRKATEEVFKVQD